MLVAAVEQPRDLVSGTNHHRIWIKSICIAPATTRGCFITRPRTPATLFADVIPSTGTVVNGILPAARRLSLESEVPSLQWLNAADDRAAVDERMIAALAEQLRIIGR
jgi:hypothetical protein